MQGKFLDESHRLLHKLGSGSFGDIFQVENIDTSETFAIKIVTFAMTQEKKRTNKDSRLMQQARLYEMLKEAQGVCRVYNHGILPDYCFLIMQKLLYSLDDLFQMCGKRFSVGTVFHIAEQIISRLERFHQTGYVHRDLKSGNFMISSAGDTKTIYIIDFGLAKPYKDSNTGEHIKRKGGKSMVGTAKFASISSHDGFEQCRRDDLESLAFMLIYFLKGTLPWQGIKEKIKSVKYAKIGQVKRALTAEQLCENLPEELLTFLKAVRKIDFTEKPNYAALKNLFKAHQKATLDWDTIVANKFKAKELSEEEFSERSY